MEEFTRYGWATMELYFREYPWYPLSPTIHKICTHSGEIQERVPLPLGAMSEGAAETTHRMRKMFRLYFTRKMSRLLTMQDLLNRSIDISDPVIIDRAKKCGLYKPKESDTFHSLLREARHLLEIYDEPPSPGPSRTTVNRNRDAAVDPRNVEEIRPFVFPAPPPAVNDEQLLEDDLADDDDLGTDTDDDQNDDTDGVNDDGDSNEGSDSGDEEENIYLDDDPYPEYEWRAGGPEHMDAN